MCIVEPYIRYTMFFKNNTRFSTSFHYLIFVMILRLHLPITGKYTRYNSGVPQINQKYKTGVP